MDFMKRYTNLYDRQEYLCDTTFDARRRKNTVLWAKTQDEPCA